MKPKKYELEYGGQFLKDLKLAKRRGLNMKDLTDITDLLQDGKSLPWAERGINKDRLT